MNEYDVVRCRVYKHASMELDHW